LILYLKNRFNCSSYLILRDIFPQWALDTGVLKKGLVFKLLQFYEYKQYKSADFIGVQSPRNLDYFDNLNLKNKFNVEVLYNWVNLKELNFEKTNYRSSLNLNNKIVFFYGGNIGIAQDLDCVIRLALKLQGNNKIHFLIVGDGSETKRLKNKINNLSLTNIEIHPPVDQSTYLSMLSEFDVGIITLDRKFKTPNFPGKMLGYMYFSKPILACINSGNDLQNILEEYNSGLVSINGDDQKFLQNALKLANDENLRVNSGLNGKKLLSKVFSVEKAVNQIISHF
jgi:glycosyltransferase involved in cell wall biosynthesis